MNNRCYYNVKLEQAVKTSKLKEVHSLLEYKADPNYMDSSGSSLLRYSVKNNKFFITKALLNAGADVNKQLAAGSTALCVAAVLDFYNIAKLLLKNGANPDIKNSSDEFALLYAVQNYLHTPVCGSELVTGYGMSELLIDYNASVTLSCKGYSSLVEYVNANTHKHSLFRKYIHDICIIQSKGKLPKKSIIRKLRFD